jgi:hypothetical protein
MFKDLIKNHDWYYQYSDNSRVYDKGYNSSIALEKEYKRLACPFSMKELHAWSWYRVIGKEPKQFVLIKDENEAKNLNITFNRPGYYQRGQNPNWNISALQEVDVISEDRFVEIDNWIKDK